MKSVARTIGNSIGKTVRQGSNPSPLPDMWTPDEDTGGYLVDENGGVIVSSDSIE